MTLPPPVRNQPALMVRQRLAGPGGVYSRHEVTPMTEAARETSIVCGNSSFSVAFIPGRAKSPRGGDAKRQLWQGQPTQRAALPKGSHGQNTVPPATSGIRRLSGVVPIRGRGTPVRRRPPLLFRPTPSPQPHGPDNAPVPHGARPRTAFS